MDIFETKSVDDTIALGKKLAQRMDVGCCVGLCGQLGAGKTVLVKGIAAGLGLDDTNLVRSPTFVLVHEYPARVPLFHLDLYRLAGEAEELVDLGIDEMLDDGVVLIEWAERGSEFLPLPRLQIEIEITGRESRRFKVFSQTS